ncbi:PAS domain-containing sensor histidine kinase, partial [Desulfovibrio sp. OttesenSCG-928-O18]|nr:PAS domain-containing sensor histidine kinase [Desulfovibrio sp. OttesenSCG-928-O18]
ILRKQREASMEHLELTSMAILQAVDSSLRRGPFMGMNRFSTDTRDFFRDLENSGDILFVGIIDESGTRLVVEGESRTKPLEFPDGALREMKNGSRWLGVAKYGHKPIYVAARKIQTAQPGMRRGGMGRHHQSGTPPETEPAATPALFLTVAVDMDKHFAVYKGFRRTAIFQTAYILAAAVFLWILAARFISRRKLAGKALYLERLQARLIDNLPDGLLIADQTGAIQAANPAAHAILASRGPTLVGKNLAEISLSFDAPVTGAAPNGWRQAAIDGMQLEVRGLPFQSEAETSSLMVIIRDRTMIRNLEKNLAEAEKLAAIGSLAAGVAHEIRNPLSALRGFAQYFAKKLTGKQPEEEYARTMVREADRLNRVITDLLYLARPRDLAPAPTDLATLCGELGTLLEFELREQGMELSCRLAAPEATADPDALKQALLNLLLNAVEAMGAETGAESGKREVALDSERGTWEGRNGVWISVTDTGPGMDEAGREQAFKPFFTTKKKGTGLGLALVQTIMHGHGGTAAIESPMAEGATTGCRVRLFFPDADGTDEK